MDAQVSIPPPPPPPPPAFFAETTAPQLTAPPPPPPPQPVTTSVASPATQDRVWLHPWTAAEMRENASQWSLAGDAGLLLYLEQFSDKLVQRADAIQQHLNQTVNAVKSTHTRVQNCLNEFTSLANTQFIENRVYDEDETANATASKKDEQSTEKTNVSTTEAQEKVLQRYVEAIQYGLAILDTHFERVEAKLDTIQNGTTSIDDDDEDGGVPNEPILEPKDPYIFRPLPHLIGTTEFMQDDYVGLGDLLRMYDEEIDDVPQIEKVDSDSALSSSDEDDDDEFKVEVSSVPIVAAGESRPDLVNRPPPPTTTTLLTDSEDDDDPFGMGNVPKFNVFSTEKNTNDNDFFGETIIPERPKPSIIPERPKPSIIPVEGSDNEEDSIFGLESKKPPDVIKNEVDDFDSESLTSKESDEPEPPKRNLGVTMFAGDGGQKGMSELEKAVERRRLAMGGPDLPPVHDDDDTEKPPITSNETLSSIVIQTKTKPSSNEQTSSTISKLTSQPLTTPEKSSKPSIFGKSTLGDDDDDDDDDDKGIFGVTPKKQPTTTYSKPPTIIPPKKEKDIFDHDDDEDEDPFKMSIPSTSKTTKKTESDLKTQSTGSSRPKGLIQPDLSDDDQFFAPEKTQSKPVPPPSKVPVISKTKSPSSDEDLFKPSAVTKPPPSSTIAAKTSDDEDPLFIGKSPVQQPVASVNASVPVTKAPVKKPIPSTNDSSDDDLGFGISKAKPITETQKAITPDKSKDADKVSNTTKPTVPTKGKSKAILTDSEEDDELFPSKPLQVNFPPRITLPPLPPPPTEQTHVDVDPLSGISNPIKTTPQSSPITEPIKTTSPPIISQKKTVLTDSDDEDSSSEKNLNPGALKEGEKRSVTDIAAILGKTLKDIGKPGPRPKPPLITEESPKPSVDDEPSVQTVEPPTTAPKKIQRLDSISDDEIFSSPKKKETPTAPIVEKKETINTENENLKTSIKERSSRLLINPMTLKPGAQRIPTSNEENKSMPTETAKEAPTGDKTTLDMQKDRIKVLVKKTPRTRTPRSAGTAAAASTNENDDLFALPTSTNTATASPPPPSPPPVAVPSPVPVTGLPNNTAAIAAKSNKQINIKEKKKFSLFDSDDSDTDELLFGFNKKNKTPVVSKPTTTPSAAAKSTVLPLDDDDDNDFLSKRPIKKSTKPVGNDDIFADVKTNSQQTNKAKKDWSIMNKSATDDKDDIFNDIPPKSSTATKPKPTNVKNKTTKDLDDIFDDPLNVSSKR